MTEPAVHDCPFCRGAGCSHCGGGEVDDREIYQAPTKPGVYEGISDEVYHGDRNSLSSSGARKLLPPSCPAVFKYERDHREQNEDYDLGHAVHALVLGTGLEIVEVKATAWRTNDAKKQRADAYKVGKVPLLTAGVKKAEAMAAAVDNHAGARELLLSGRPEVSMYWTDPATWTRLRSRPDWMTDAFGPLMLVDLKTTKAADPQLFRASASSIGYHQQAAWYIDGARELLDVDPRLVFLAIEKEPPYLVSLHEFERDDIETGRRLNRLAIEIYAACVAEDYWPGYGDHIHSMRLTSKARYHAEELLS